MFLLGTSALPWTGRGLEITKPQRPVYGLKFDINLEEPKKHKNLFGPWMSRTVQIVVSTDHLTTGSTLSSFIFVWTYCQAQLQLAISIEIEQSLA